MLNAAFVRSFNEQFIKPVFDSRTQARMVSSVGASDLPDLVAELSIQIVRSSVERNSTIQSISQDELLLNEAWTRSLHLIDRYEGRPPKASNLALPEGELEGALQLARNLWAFICLIGDEEVLFSPRIPGAGTISACEADLSLGSMLIEIKTVSRRFTSYDLRQTLVYLALDWAKGNPRWTRACLVNPKRATWADFDVDWVVRRLSGRSAVDTFAELLAAFTAGIELETSSF